MPNENPKKLSDLTQLSDEELKSVAGGSEPIPQAYYVSCHNCNLQAKYRDEAQATKLVIDHEARWGHDAYWVQKNDNNFI